MAYPVNEIANYVIEFAKNKNMPVNNLKLQKILYYLQGRFLAEKGETLFNEPIEKWKYGPVVPSVYFRFNHLGAENIEQIPKNFNFNLLFNDDFDFDDFENTDEAEFDFDSEDKVLIDDTINTLISFRAFYLVDETHKHESWLKDKPRIMSGERHIEYERKEMENDFALPENKIWLNTYE